MAEARTADAPGGGRAGTARSRPDGPDRPPSGPGGRRPDLAASRPANRRSLPYNAAFDGLRGLGVLAIMWGHLGHADGAIYAIDAFFLLSGHLITNVLLGSWERHGRIRLKRFWGRRARRLLPVLLLLLMAVAVYAKLVADPSELARIRSDGLSALFYVNNWHSILVGNSYADIFRAPSPLTHVWTLSIEEQYYLVWPLLIVAVAWATRRRERVERLKVLFWVAVALAVSSAVVTQVLLSTGADLNRLYLGTDTRAFALATGSASAIGIKIWGHLRSERWVKICDLVTLSLVGATVVVWIAAPVVSGIPFRFGFVTADCVVLFGIWFLARPGESVSGRLLSFKPLVWLGLVSYGLYLWHWPVYVWLTPQRLGMAKGIEYDLLVMGISIAVAAVSFYLFEVPILRGAISGRTALVVTPAAVVLVAVALVASSSAQPSVEDQITGLGQSSTKLLIPTGVPAPADPGRPHILVVGDSQAVALGQGFVRLQHPKDLSAMNRGAVGCGIVGGKPSSQFGGGVTFADPPGCSDWATRWKGYVESYDPNVVLVVIGNPGLGKRFIQGEWRDACDPVYRSTYLGDVERALRLVTSKGANAYVLTAPWGSLKGSPFATYVQQFTPAIGACVNQTYRQATEAVPKSHIIDLARWLCDEAGNCKEEIDGVTLRTDRFHFKGKAADLIDSWIIPQLKVGFSH